MIADDVVTLIAADGYGVKGTDLFKGPLPTSPSRCLAVAEYGGEAPDYVFGEPGPAIDKPRAQVKARGKAFDYDGPRTVLELIYQAVCNRGAFIVNGTRYMSLFPLGSPSPLGQDANNCWVWVLNLAAEKDRSSLLGGNSRTESARAASAERADVERTDV